MNRPRTEFKTALATYDRRGDRDAVQQAERERREVTTHFPLGSWPTLALERYALGQAESKDTFCRWMEFRTQHLGSIKGGNARKLIVYKHRDQPGWYFDPQYPNEQKAWEALRADFVRAFDYARSAEWNSIDGLSNLQSGPALCLKAFHVYFPQDILPVYSKAHLRHFLDLLGNSELDPRALEAVGLNRELLAALRKHPEFKDWSTNEIQRFLYHWADPREQTRVVKIAPGERGEFWNECLEGGYICVGWDEVGDLREYESKESFRAEFERKYLSMYNGSQSSVTKKAGELWTLMELEPGDTVVANRGTSEILAVGEVVEPAYGWRPQRETNKHTVSVKWDVSGARQIPSQKRWAFITVGPLSPTLYQTISSRTSPQDHAAAPIEPRFADIAAALEGKGQVILYGPPGTGKTYHARRFAVAWLLKQNGRAENVLGVLADPGRFRQIEETLTSVAAGQRAGQLTRLTFHPSYSYEDFIEGFRPVADKDNALSLRLEAGVFLRVCQAAQAEPQKKFLVFIDEINRANLAKVLGEVITLLERDKRRMTLILPQSKEHFAIPENVFLLGTMNTADRSIKLLDAALRRRFAFIELMPDIEVLRGAKVLMLPLDDFLEELNRRIAENEGREKQIGHSFLLDGAEPISDPEEFARRFRQEILPLLQEYCYDDYGTLATYLGTKLVNASAHALDSECLADADALVAALAEAFRPTEIPRE